MKMTKKLLILTDNLGGRSSLREWLRRHDSTRFFFAWENKRREEAKKIRGRIRLEDIIIEHVRQPKAYHTWFIVFLLAVIVVCLVIIAGATK